MNENVVEVKGITKEFTVYGGMDHSVKSFFVNPFRKINKRKFLALDNVSFNIKKGEFVGLIGRNGSGKSTLLKVLSSIYEADGGEFNVYGRLVPFLELGVGFHPDLTARDNIYLNGTILGMTRKYLNSKFEEIMEFSGLWDFIETPLKRLSSGMQVRLAFAVGIQSDADIFIWDEVLAVGDLEFQQKSQKKFAELKEKGVSVILVSHDMDEIKEYSDRVIWLDKGVIKMEGDPKSVVSEYISSYDKNEDKGKVE